MDLWRSETSVQDPLRTISKMHITTAPPSTTDRVAAANKAAGYLVTDLHTPIIGKYCRAVLRICGTPDVAKMLKEERVKFESPWPQDPHMSSEMRSCVEGSTGINS